MIQIVTASADLYYLSILRGPNFDEDRSRVLDMPDKRGVYVDKNGIQVFSHYEVPRCDVSEVVRRWQDDECTYDTGFTTDLKTWKRVSKPVDPAKCMIGDLHIPAEWEAGGKLVPFRLKDLQEQYIRTDPHLLRLWCPADTGQGKTLMTAFRAKVLLQRQEKQPKVLVLTIDSVLKQWLADLRFVFGVEPLIYSGTKTQRAKLLEKAANSSVIITTYSAGFELTGIDFNAYILDEADVLSNPDTKLAQSYEPMRNKSWGSVLQIATATPMGQRAGSLWYLTKWIHPLIAGSRSAFELRYEVATSTTTRMVKTKYGYREMEVASGHRFQNKRQWLEKLQSLTGMTKPTEETSYREEIRNIDVELTEEQTVRLQDLRERAKTIVGRRRISIQQKRNEIVRIMQTLETLGHFEPEMAHESGKLIYLKSLLRTIDHPVIIWSPFKELPTQIAKAFPDRAVLFNGDQTKGQRDLARWGFGGCRTKEEFEEYYKLQAKYGGPKEPGTADFFCGTYANLTSRGMNLQRCWHQIFTSPTFSGRTYKQVIGRVLRIGQTASTVYTDRLICDPVELSWWGYTMRRLKDMKEAKGCGTSQLTSSDADDLLDLLL